MQPGRLFVSRIEHRAKLCLLGLRELQRTWDVTNWVLELFFQYLDRSTAARLAVDDQMSGASNARLQQQQHLTPDQTAQPQPLSLSTLQQQQQAQNVQIPGMPNNDPNVASPWSWTTDEANQFLFSQIENEFAFGEGGTLDWSPDDGFPNMMVQMNDGNANLT